MNKIFQLFLGIIIASSLIPMHAQKAVATLQLSSSKSDKLVIYLVGKTTSMEIDCGDGVKTPIEVPSEVPSNLNSIAGVRFSPAVDNATIKIYGEGLKALLYPYPGMSGTLQSIDVSQAQDLEVLDVDNSGISSLDVTHNPKLRILMAFGIPTLSKLDLTNNVALEELKIQMTNIRKLDLSHQENLKSLMSFGNKNIPNLSMFALESIDLSQCPNIEEVIAYESNLKSINITNCTKLSKLWIHSNKELNSIKLQNNTALTDVQIYNLPKLTKIDFSQMPNVEYLSFNDTPLTEADLSACSKLKELFGYNCKLKKILVNAQAVFTKSIQLFSNDLDACALDKFYKSLGQIQDNSSHKNIVLLSTFDEDRNPGIGTSKTSIAKEKGWTVVKTNGRDFEELQGDGSGCNTQNTHQLTGYDSRVRLIPIGGNQVEIRTPMQIEKIMIYNELGKCVKLERGKTKHISMKDLPKGTYIFLLEDIKGDLATQRIVL